MHRTIIIKALSITLLLSCTAHLSAMSRKDARKGHNKKLILGAGPTNTGQMGGGSVTLSPQLLAQLPEGEPEDSLEETAVVQEAAAAPAPVSNKEAVVQLTESAFAQEQGATANDNNAGAAAKIISFLNHPIVAETKQGKPASLQTSSWRDPIANRETRVVAALQEASATNVQQALNSGDLVKVINQHMGNFVQTLQDVGTNDIQSLERVLAPGLIEMRAAYNLLKLCDEYPNKRMEKIGSLNTLLNNPESTPQEKEKVQEQLTALEKCTTARPQDATLILALKTLSTARLLQLEKLQQRMREGFGQLREIQTGIQLAFNMMPDEVKSGLPDGLVVHKDHTDDFIYNLTMK